MIKEKAILVGVKFPGDILDCVVQSLDELGELASTAGAIVSEKVIQQRRDIDTKYYIGKGKVDQIKNLYISKKDINLIIFNHDLTAAQIRNLEKGLKIKVITRTELIFDIFVLHARTKTAKLQVELAQLNYQLPRITGKGILMSRLGGGIGTRGPGEKQVELDRRLIQRRLFLIKKRMNQIEHERSIQRKNRIKREFRIAIVGYTNSGKTSLLNRLTKTNIPAEDKLFATLDTTTRKLWLGYEGGFPVRAVITDTVGFIRDIPHGLIESFKSTLEETIQSVSSYPYPGYLITRFSCEKECC